VKYDNFVGGTYVLPSLAVNAERAINLYPESVGGAGKAKIVFRTTPGLMVWATLPTAPVRCICSDVGPDDALTGSGRSLFAIAGDTLYQIFADGTFAAKVMDSPNPPMANDGGPAYMYPNGRQFLIISAGFAYCYDGVHLAPAQVPADDTLLATTDGGGAGGDDYTATSAAYKDKVFIATKLNSNRFFYSDFWYPNSATTPPLSVGGFSWNALYFGSCESSPDRILRVLADHGELYFFGDRSTEVWRTNSDLATINDNFFTRDPNGTIPIGIAAVRSAVNLVDGPAWIGANAEGNPIAFAGRGFQPTRISTYSVEQAWASYSTIADAIGYTYTEDGHTFWVLQFPAGNATWAYDTKEQMWHERAYWNGTTLERQRGNCHAYQYVAGGTGTVNPGGVPGVTAPGMYHLIGDRTSGVIYRSSVGMLDDFGTPIHRVRTAPHLHDEANQIFYHRLQLDIGDPTGAHNLATLEWSDDAGVNWSNPVVASTSSVTPKKLRRLMWRRLGASRDRVYRVTFPQAAPLSVVDAYLELDKGIS
jgi:hypothetical protein